MATMHAETTRRVSAFTALLVFAIATTAHAATLTVTGATGDVCVNSDWHNKWDTNWDRSNNTEYTGTGSSYGGGPSDVFVGSGYRNVDGNPGFVAVFPFQLPSIGANQEITAATLTLTTVDPPSGGMWGDHDLYGLAGDESTLADDTVLPNMMFRGPGPDSTDAVQIADKFILDSDDVAAGQTFEADVLSYILSQYGTSYENSGKYSFFRVGADSKFGTTNDVFGVRFASADNTTASYRPTLTLTVVPEPATLAVLALAGTALLQRRSRTRSSAL